MRNKIKPHSSAYPPSPLTLAHYPNVANLAMDNLLCTGKWKVTDPFSIVRIRFLDGILTKAVRPTSTGITYNRSKLAQFYQRICLTVPFTAETSAANFSFFFFRGNWNGVSRPNDTIAAVGRGRKRASRRSL